MPPLGAGLSDEQIAAVLTYVRRQWGNEASAVDPKTVKDTRALTAGRTRPWTNDELLAIGQRRARRASRATVSDASTLLRSAGQRLRRRRLQSRTA